MSLIQQIKDTLKDISGVEEVICSAGECYYSSWLFWCHMFPNSNFVSNSPY
jgi:hypothetical protein